MADRTHDIGIIYFNRFVETISFNHFFLKDFFVWDILCQLGTYTIEKNVLKPSVISAAPERTLLLFKKVSGKFIDFRPLQRLSLRNDPFLVNYPRHNLDFLRINIIYIIQRPVTCLLPSVLLLLAQSVFSKSYYSVRHPALLLMVF